MVISIGAFSAVDEDGFYLMLLNTKKSIGIRTGLFSLNQAEKGKKGNGNGYWKRIVSSGTINLALIDKINENLSPKNGYIKEYLSMMRDNQDGKYNKGRDHGAPVVVNLGVHESEKGGQWYFYQDQWKKNSKDYSFAGFTSKSKRTNPFDSSSGVSWMQWTHGESGFDHKATIDPVNNKRGWSHGDPRFFPDGLAYTSANLYAAEKELSGISDEAMGMASAIINNRGSLYRSVTGHRYYGGANDSFSKPIYYNKMTKKQRGRMVQALYDIFENAASNAKGGIASGGPAGLCYAMACMVKAPESDQWFLSQTAYNKVIKYSYVQCYKEMWGSKGKSDQEIKNDLKKHIAKNLAESINKVNGTNLSTSDTKKIYDESSDYGSGYSQYGNVWYVSKYKVTGVYPKEAYQVSTWDAVTFRYAYNTSGAPGSKYYAKLLKKAGVNTVDPTNPETYSGTTTRLVWVSTGGDGKKKVQNYTYSEDLKGLIPDEIKIDESKLSENRRLLLVRAANMVKSKKWVYVYGGRGRSFKSKGDISEYSSPLGSNSITAAVKNGSANWSKKWFNKEFVSNIFNIPTAKDFYDGKYFDYPIGGVDCSGFVYYVSKKVGFPLEWTCASAVCSDQYHSTVSLSKVKCMDLINSDGHVVFYVAGNPSKGTWYTVESEHGGTFVSFRSQPANHLGRRTIKSAGRIKVKNTKNNKGIDD